MIEQLISRVKLRQSEIAMSLAVGAPINWESYQRLVGEHQGLQATLDIIDNMLEEEEGKQQ